MPILTNKTKTRLVNAHSQLRATVNIYFVFIFQYNTIKQKVHHCRNYFLQSHHHYLCFFILTTKQLTQTTQTMPTTTEKLIPISLADCQALIGHTWFDHESENEDDIYESSIVYSTRENGDVGKEEAGQADIEEARRIIKCLRAKFPMPDYRIDGDVCDEWVTITIWRNPILK